MEAEDLAEAFQVACVNACMFSMPHRKPVPNNNKTAWWNNDLSRRRSEVRKARKRFQEERDSVSRAQLRYAFKELRRQYKDEILEARKISFRNFCSQQSAADPWSLVYKILAKKKKSNVNLQTIQREDGSWTESEKETMEALLDKYFPEDNANEDNPEQVLIRDRYVVPFQVEDDRSPSANFEEPSRISPRTRHPEGMASLPKR